MLSDTLTFETRQQPGLLTAQVTADGIRLRVNATVRGKPHADIQMVRVTSPQAIAAFRASNALSKDRAPGAALQQALTSSAQSQIDSTLPAAEQARAHLGEARKLVAQMAGAPPSEIPGLALRMKGHLDRAVELDPANDEAQLQLAIWYLNAPEVAGGGKAKAQDILKALEQKNSPRAEALRKELADRP